MCFLDDPDLALAFYRDARRRELASNEVVAKLPPSAAERVWEPCTRPWAEYGPGWPFGAAGVHGTVADVDFAHTCK